MRLSRIEPGPPGFDLRIFECANCESSKAFVVAI